MIEYALWILAGTLYGTIIGVIPVAGATIGLLAVFGMTDSFLADPYLGVVFMTSFLGAVSSSDSFTSILTGIPGSGSTAASIIDGHPMAKQGQGGRAIGIALMDSTVNGVFWGLLAFGLMPLYGKLILVFGIPEFAALMFLSLACVGFITVKNPWLSVVSILLGLFLGLIGQDPATGAHRLTFDWEYLAAGIQIVPIIAGIFAVPEILDCLRGRISKPPPITNYSKQLVQGFADCWRCRKDMIRGGVIGFFTGILPGVGGSAGDMMAYGATVAKNPDEKFGNGNPRGLIGCEGANNAQKPASLIPTILFGIPGAPFAALMMAICVMLGLELGTPALLEDQKFIWSVGAGFLISTVLSFFICLFIAKWVVKILEIPNWIYASIIASIVVWSSMQYSGTANDLYILVICGIIGVIAKEIGLSRPAILLAYVVAEKFENYTQQSLTLYNWIEILSRPLTLVLLALSLVIVINSIRKYKGITFN
jgi:putative tricarboxylic transport membrane protein